ncbi:MAG: endonuclease domain-containing protein, partial [Planctomycetota bacterium]
IGSYIVDFACPDKKLVVEIDGDYHEQVLVQDLKRQNEIQSRGWHVARFTNEDVLNNLESVLLCLQKIVGL